MILMIMASIKSHTIIISQCIKLAFNGHSIQKQLYALVLTMAKGCYHSAVQQKIYSRWMQQKKCRKKILLMVFLLLFQNKFSSPEIYFLVRQIKLPQWQRTVSVLEIG